MIIKTYENEIWNNCHNMIKCLNENSIEKNLFIYIIFNRCKIIYEKSDIKYWKNVSPEYIKFIKKASIDEIFNTKSLNQEDLEIIKFVSEILIKWYQFKLYDNELYMLLLDKIDNILICPISKIIKQVILQTYQAEDNLNRFIMESSFCKN